MRVRKTITLLFTILIFNLTNVLKAQVFTINTIAGTGFAGFSNDGGMATNAMVYYPLSLALDSSNNIYIADWDNSRIRKINTGGIITTITGNGEFSFSGDGGNAGNAELNGPTGVSTDKLGNIYIADIGNGRIRKISTNGHITTIAGNGLYGFSGDGGAANLASFKDPTGVTVDDSGNIFIADVFNNRIRKINLSGIITTIAGNGTAGFAGDGGAATLAELYYPTGTAIDTAGNIYIADEDNNRIRKVTKTGIITTIAGNGIGGFSGDGGAATNAQLNFPGGVAIDAQQNVYIADASNNRIRMVDTHGIITTVAGTGIPGYSGDNELALAAELNNPTGITIDKQGNLIVGDAFNFRVRELTRINSRNFGPGAESLLLYPNPNYGTFNVELTNSNIVNETLDIYNLIGEKIFTTQLSGNTITKINLGRITSGLYIYRLGTPNQSTHAYGKFVIL